MRCRYRLFAENDVALRTLKCRIRFSSLDLEIHCAAIVSRRGHVAHAARCYRDAFRLCVERVHRLDIVACIAAQLGVACEFMPERPRRIPPAPRVERYAVSHPDLRCKPGIEVARQCCLLDLVTRRTIGRCWSDPGICLMACETRCMPDRDRLERSLFQPEPIAQRRRRFRHILIWRVALRVQGFVTYNAAFFSQELRFE